MAGTHAVPRATMRSNVAVGGCRALWACPVRAVGVEVVRLFDYLLWLVSQVSTRGVPVGQDITCSKVAEFRGETFWAAGFPPQKVPPSTGKLCFSVFRPGPEFLSVPKAQNGPKKTKLLFPAAGVPIKQKNRREKGMRAHLGARLCPCLFRLGHHGPQITLSPTTVAVAVVWHCPTGRARRLGCAAMPWEVGIPLGLTGRPRAQKYGF